MKSSQSIAQGAYVRLSSGLDPVPPPPNPLLGPWGEGWGEGERAMREFHSLFISKKSVFVPFFLALLFGCNLLTFVTEFRAFQV